MRTMRVRALGVVGLVVVAAAACGSEDSNTVCGGSVEECGTGASGSASSGATSSGATGGPVDECANGTEDCADDAVCTDTAEGFTCACKDGYEGDGKTCTDVDECKTNKDDCGANATCTDTDGGFACACKDGYEGDGKTCANVDECETNKDDCGANATCTDTDGGFTCACDFGYEGDGKTCKADPCLVPVSKTTIQAAVDDATCAVVKVATGTYAEKVKVARAVEIVGAGADDTFVDGSMSGRPFSIVGAVKVTLSGLTITKGSVSDEGGGVHGTTAGAFQSGPTLKLVGCRVVGNAVSAPSSATFAYGGGIYVEDGSLELVDSVVADNQLSIKATTAFVYGGGVYSLGGNVTVTRSTIAGNKIALPMSSLVTTAGGGGLAVTAGLFGFGESGKEKLTVTDSTVSGNSITAPGFSVSTEGAGIHAVDVGSVALRQVTLSGNVHQNTSVGGTAQGGALFLGAGFGPMKVDVRSSTLTGNDILSAGFASGSAMMVTSDDVAVTLAHSLLVANGGSGTFGSPKQCDGTTVGVASKGYNLVFGNDVGCAVALEASDVSGKDPGLAALADNGGPTKTHAFAKGSAAHDKGDPMGCKDEANQAFTADQRGLKRPVGGCDIGAVELQ
jgi:hypothetical protein